MRIAWTLIACGPRVAVTPSEIPASGYVPVVLEVPVDAIDDVRVAGLGTYGWVAVDGGLEVRVQGAPEPGPAEVVVTSGERVFTGEIEILPNADPVFDQFLALGASLTQGVQGGVPTHHGGLIAPSRRIAESAGAFHPIPLLIEDLFPPITAADLGPPPGCEVPDVVGHVASAAIDVIAKMEDPATGEFGYQFVREDPDVMPYNVAVGGSSVGDLVHGPGTDFAKGFVAHMVYDPYGAVGDPVPYSQLEVVEQLEPTLVVCTDTYGNDLIGPLVEGDDIDPARLTPVEELRADLAVLIERLDATGAEVFLANMPRPTLLPITEEKRRQAAARARELAIEAGEDPDAAEAEALARVDAAIAEVEAAWEAYNAALDELAAPYDRVHVVDFGGEVAAVEQTGLEVAGHTLTVRKLDGLLSIDGVHFSDVGYAMTANLFIRTINDELGLSLPEVDLDAVYPDDPHSPDALRAQGIEPEDCTR